MSYLSDAHAEWHAVNGRDQVCPLDCGVGEDAAADYEAEQAYLASLTIRCGHCRERHATVAEVRACAGVAA